MPSARPERSLDNNISIIDQLGENESPVVLVNVFTVDPSEADNVLAAWTRDAAFMKRQPGSYGRRCIAA